MKPGSYRDSLETVHPHYIGFPCTPSLDFNDTPPPTWKKRQGMPGARGLGCG